MIKILSIFGTRPEAIKMAPVLKAIKVFNEKSSKPIIKSIVCVTAQHRKMLDQVLRLFNITPDYDLDLMTSNQTLITLTMRCLEGLHNVINEVKPDWVLVQGDTTTVLTGALAAFYSKTKIGHIEAGLRTRDKYQPFPEEINRRIASCLADLHFAPTNSSKLNLMLEGIPSKKVFITGNTVIDALLIAKEEAKKTSWNNFIEFKKIISLLENPDKRIILVTGHRRESFGEGFLQICNGLKELAKSHREISIIYPVHLNPNVQKPVKEILGKINNIILTKPLDYLPFVKLMDRSFFILTDSGGIQEEGPSLGKPVLVMRDITERPEAVASGAVKLVGTNADKIYKESVKLIMDESQYKKMSKARNPYGDGNAAMRIIKNIIKGNKVNY